MTPAERAAAVAKVLGILRACGDWWQDVLAEVCRTMVEGYVAGLGREGAT